MTWSIIKGQNINPDFEMIDKVLSTLNSVFDAYDFFHHSSNGEMFEFTYQKDDFRREAWQITFMGKSVVSGGMFGLDYEDFYEDDYLFLNKENEEKIYNHAYNNAVEYISKTLQYVAFANISKEIKLNWINIINTGIDKIEEDKQIK
jgi:hypothetical protein